MIRFESGAAHPSQRKSGQVILRWPHGWAVHGGLISTTGLDAVVCFQAVTGPVPTAFAPHVQPKRILMPETDRGYVCR
jgi:hypothetical protein